MFQFNTRTETAEGCRFYQQDILLFDYIYSGNTEIECSIDYLTPGFGFVIAEDFGGDIEKTDNLFIFKLGARNEYQIISKIGAEGSVEQKTLRDEFILAGVDINLPVKDLKLTFKFTDAYRCEVYYTKKDKNNVSINTLLFTFDLPHDINSYKIGFYSNMNNIIKTASVKSEAPSNWVSNIYNAHGGRINWIKNGFQIEDCEYDCEVECQNNILPTGRYFFNFTTDNPDIRYYIYPSEMHDTREKRPVDIILSTKDDEIKNILDYQTNSFELEEEQTVNIKFKGKWGTVKNISVNTSKRADFVETDYNTFRREVSSLVFRLDKIKKIELEGIVESVPEKALYEEEKYSIIHYGNQKEYLEDTGIELDAKFSLTYEDKKIQTINNIVLTGDSLELILLENVDAIIEKLLVTMNNGDVLDIIHQQTFKITVDKNIKSPIIVTDSTGKPYDLSGAYREIITPERTIEFFRKNSQIKLKHKLILNNSNIKVAGVPKGKTIDPYKDTIEEAAADYSVINSAQYRKDYNTNRLIVMPEIKNSFDYIIVEYNHADNFRYEFTNYERELFILAEERNIYISKAICDVVNPVTLYGIPDDAVFLEDNIYKTVSRSAINTIDCCVSKYDVLSSADYSISSTNKIEFTPGVRKKYKYIIADYLKDRSYAINERADYIEVDIAADDDKVYVLYDADSNDTTHIYSKPRYSGEKETNNYIVLRKEEINHADLPW